MKTGKKIKIAWVASSGGHILEISQLEEIEKKYDGFLVTEASEFQEFYLDKNYYVNQMNRKNMISWFFFFLSIFKALWILIKEKPSHIVSTGAMATVPFLLWGKLLGCKIIYIESFARIEDSSMTGRIVYPIADLFIVQWEEMIKVYPKAIEGGSIF